MTAREIIKQHLEENGFDGLYTDDCGCFNGDLAPCGESCSFECEAGYKVPCDPKTCPAGGECGFHIGPKEVSNENRI